MFEKEAEELIEESKRLNTTPRETVCKAIEFGYNKANEWHYVKDGDYPKDNKGKYITRKNMVFLYGDKPYEKLLNSMFIQAKLDIMHFEKALLKPLKYKENHTFSKAVVENYFSACRLLGYKPPFKFQKKWRDFSRHYVWEVIQ